MHTLLKGLEKIAASADIPMLVAGDFNTTPGSAAHTLLVKGSVPAGNPVGGRAGRVVRRSAAALARRGAGSSKSSRFPCCAAAALLPAAEQGARAKGARSHPANQPTNQATS